VTIDTFYEGRQVRTQILKAVNHALGVSERWYGYYQLYKNSKFPRGRRYALHCRAQAVVIHDRALRSS